MVRPGLSNKDKENVRPSQGSQISSKKRISSAVLTPPSSSKKTRPSPDRQTFLSLPEPVKIRLLSYLDINSLESLARTSKHFHEMINSRFLISVQFPFPMDGPFLTYLKEAEIIKKKPLLRLEFMKPGLNQNEGIHPLFSQPGIMASRYIIDSQLSFLSLQSLRELRLSPEEDPATPLWTPVQWSTKITWISTVWLDKRILERLSNLGGLRNISRLDLLLVSSDMGQFLWEKILPAMGSLRDLNITAVERCDLAG